MNRIKISKKFFPLVVWLGFQFVFALFSTNRLYSIGYFCWTLIMIALVIVFCSLVNTSDKTEWLLRSYLYTFVIMSWLGIFQWILGFCGKDFFLTQTTFNGTRIPRINGFTYEPSYYSTYLLPGWILAMYLLENGSTFFTRMQTSYYALILSLALFLSSSRMGWIFMGVYLTIRILITLYSFLITYLKKKKIIFAVLCIASIICVVSVSIYLILNKRFGFIVAGLGIGGESAHSSNARISQFRNTLLLFCDHPFAGYSLGGVPVAYCEKYNIVPFDSGASMCVWIELLAASGVFGIIPFVIWIGSILKDYKKKYNDNIYLVNESRGLLYAFAFECMILAMNQNILRIYFWVLLAILIIVGKENRKNIKVKEYND